MGGAVQRTTFNLTDEAYQIATKRIGHARRGLGHFLSGLVMQDEARRDERVLAEKRLADALTTARSWQETSCRVD